MLEIVNGNLTKPLMADSIMVNNLFLIGEPFNPQYN